MRDEENPAAVATAGGASWSVQAGRQDGPEVNRIPVDRQPDRVVDLLAEFCAAASHLGPRHFARMRQIGVAEPEHPALRWGVARVLVDDDAGLYQPHAAGRPAVVIAEWPHRAAVPLDLVAFFTDDPSRWWRRTGIVDVLGTDAIADAEWRAEPLIIFDDPLAWLRSTGGGVCVIDWKFDPRAAFAGVRKLIGSAAVIDAIQARALDLAMPRWEVAIAA